MSPLPLLAALSLACAGQKDDRPIGVLEGRFLAESVFSPDGKLIATMSRESSDVVLWDVKTRKELRRLSGLMPNPRGGSQSGGLSLAFSPDSRLVTACRSDHSDDVGLDRSFAVWEVAGGKKLLQPSAAFERAVEGVCFSSDGRHVIAYGEDNTPEVGTRSFKFWTLGPDVEKGPSRTIREFIGHRYSPKVRPGTEQVLAWADPNGFSLYDLKNEKLLDRVQRDEKSRSSPACCRSAAFSPDGKLLAITGVEHVVGTQAEGSSRGYTKVWDIEGKKLLVDLWFPQIANYVSLSPDGKTIATAVGSWKETSVFLHDVPTGRLLRTLEGEGLTTSAISPDGTLLAIKSSGIALWRLGK